mgnify:FL=1
MKNKILIFFILVLGYFIFNNINVSAVPACSLSIDTLSLPDGTVGTSYSATISASATSCSGVYIWSIISGSLPAGLNLIDSGSTTATISGTPTTSGTSSFTIQIADELNPAYKSSRS